MVITTTGASPLMLVSPVRSPTRSGAVLVRQLGVLLVAQGLDRGGVERLEPALERQVDGELPHDRLAGTRGGGHQDTPAGLQGQAGLALEVVEFEGERTDETAQIGFGFCGPLGTGSVAFRRRFRPG